ncbi:probable glutathione S-transferase [Vicia villosa]|uniref:probable glutathione S-transferase n=1 Tax=Vicia villosa TaxID=3911 RepID=UPI00273C8BE9|nr:probable glutathione S-transferase [Vicia villosa]
MADEVILLNFWPSHYGMRVLIALEEKGIKYENKEEDFSNKSLLLLQMNPIHKKIPVLIHNGKSICESLNIVEYIDEVWNHHSPLFHSDPYQKAQAKFWANYVDTKIYEIGSRYAKTEGEEKEAAKKELLESFEVMEGQLGDKPYFGGENFGFVDVALVPLFCMLYSYTFAGKFIDDEEFPNLTSWAKRCGEKESVSRSIPKESKMKQFLAEMSLLNR